jgi:beta-lactamase superfamily II metal-dependent hydrolase
MSPPNTSQPKMRAPQSGVTVRMYDTGFGDCLLLATRADDGTGRYMMIDFGVHHSYPDPGPRMRLIAKDIAEATGNHLHVVAATHEHTDHLYGFKHAEQEFDPIEVDELWLAWTEDPTDTVAADLRDRYGMKIRALEAAVGLLGSAGSPLADRLRGVLDFEFPGALAATGGNKAQLDYLREKSAKKLLGASDYRRPGQILTLPGVGGVRIYVLGPPRDVDWIKSLVRSSELYPELTAVDEVGAFAAAALELAGGDSLDANERERLRRGRPFDSSLELTRKTVMESAAYKDFFSQHYGFSTAARNGPEWRRIDEDWLGAAEDLALAINSKTNNTSLVLAVELTESEQRKVLLFAADAQVGNWLSWQEIKWPDEGDGQEKITTKGLLERTVLYKVGHHGSRNATLSHKGLEMMQSGELVAMIPVDEEWALDAQGWEHPAEKLLERLYEKCKGRILRTDDIPYGNSPPARPQEATAHEWHDFLRHLDWDRSEQGLWVQYTVTA